MQCVKRVATHSKLFVNHITMMKLCILPRMFPQGTVSVLGKLPELIKWGRADINTSAIVAAWVNKPKEPRKFLRHNKTIYPPQVPEEKPRPAYVCHVKSNIKYSPWKMWYIATMVRGMTVSEALKQLSFVSKKGAKYVKEAILEAQQKAVEQHNVEFSSNLWVAESFVSKGAVFRGLRRHARMRVGKVEYFHCHYFVRLEEGKPPEHYYPYSRPLTGPEMLEKWLQQMRNRKITSSL